jgi:mannose-1-phosphate guanylyltransferase/phosphomannomutase
MKAVILAGGQGVRLRPLTTKIPKPMVPIMNSPFLQIMLDNLKFHGIQEIIMTIGYLPDRIKEYFEDGRHMDMSIEYVLEESPMGTAGAVKNVESSLDGTFLVLNGDIVTDLDLESMIKFHRENESKVTIFLNEVEDTSSFGVVEIDATAKVIRFLEKPEPGETDSKRINGGIYLIEPDIMDQVPVGEFYMFERGLFPKLLKNDVPVYGFVATPYWVDVGTHSNYFKVNIDMANGDYIQPGEASRKKNANGIAMSTSVRIHGSLILGDNCEIGSNVVINGTVILGNRTRIGNGTVINECILWQDVVISDNVTMNGCIIGNRVYIGDNTIVEEGSIIGDDVVIAGGKHIYKGSIIEADESIN